MDTARGSLVDLFVYLLKMWDRGRVAIICKERRAVAICTFFLLDSIGDIEKFHERPLWSTPLDSATGVVCYIDKLITGEWNGSARRQLEKTIMDAYPQVQWYCYHRDAGVNPDRFHIRPVQGGVLCKS